MEFTMRLRKTASRNKTEEINANNNKIIKKRKKAAGLLCKKCVCSPLQVSTFDFPPVWLELRNNSQLCDGVVKCEDGTEFKIHRAILAAVSPYFKALFTNSINRDPAEATEAKMNINGEIFQIFLDYAYTGNCIINKTNVRGLLKYADQYQILDIVQLCCNFLIEELAPSNCLEILKFASQYFCKDLIERGRLYVKHNFPKLLKDSYEFYNISVQHLEEILRDDELNVKTDETVFEAIKMWINYSPIRRKIHLLTLIKCIRLGTLTYDSVQEMSKWHLIEENIECKEYLRDILTVLGGLGQEDDVDYINNYLFRPRIPFGVLFAVGGWSAGSPTNFLETYDSRADKWLFSVDTDSSPRAYHGLCNLNGMIYMIGGFDGNEYFNTVRCFDPLVHKWSERSCMYYPRCYVSVVVHGGNIYAMGGYNGRTRMNSAERYNPEKNQWEIITPMQKQRSDASAAVALDKIYIVGGFNGQEVMNSAEVYDPVTKQWSYIPQMNSARSGVSLIAYGNTLYAIGGFNGYTRLASGEKYNPELSAAWSDISEMLTPRSNFATVILDDYIFVIGGFNDRFVSELIVGSTTINYVEYYDTESNEWYDAASMNVSRSALSACVVHGLPNAKEYTFLRRNTIEIGPDASNGDR
nr:kelch-like protein 10 isoform X1 [Leptinotarsa decemlineata]